MQREQVQLSGARDRPNNLCVSRCAFQVTESEYDHVHRRTREVHVVLFTSINKESSVKSECFSAGY